LPLAPHVGVGIVAGPAHDGGVAVGRKRDGGALGGVPNRAGADQLVALLGPDTAAAGGDPRRPDARIVVKPAHDSSVAVGGQRDGSLVDGYNRAGADQLGPLLHELGKRQLRGKKQARIRTNVLTVEIDQTCAIIGTPS
jgi:hypothetical protein